MNPLLMLLGQQAGVPATEEFANEILVEAPRKGERSSGPVDGMSAPNDRAIEAVQADVARGQEASDRRGMFGMKGTLRDVLGVVGDAFLIQSGKSPMYAPSRRQEQISDAWAGASEDPLAAAERVGYYDAKMGQEILGEYESNLVKKAQAESLTASREDLARDRAFKQYQKAREMIGGLLQTPGAVANGVISPAALKQAERIAASANMTLEEFMIAEGMSEQDVRNYARSVIDPYKQEVLVDKDVALGQGQQNADSRRTSANASMIRAQRPPAGRAPPQPTEASMLSEFMKIPRSKRTPEQQAFIERKTQPIGSSKGGKRTVPSSGTSGWTIRPKGQ